MINNKITFCGDFFYDYSEMRNDIQRISEYVQKENLNLIVNLEAPLVVSDKKISKRGPNLAQGDLTIEILKKLNIVGVCLANNHMMDYGADALKRTIELLDENNIMHTGAGMNIDEACKPMEFETEDTCIAILDYGWDIEEVVIAKENEPGSAPRDKEQIISDIKKYVCEKKRVIVNMHWGFEFNMYPQPYDISLAHAMIDAGAELVIGHHPHVIQPRELYHENMIYYSLGNFYFGSRRKRYKKIFPTVDKYECDKGLLVHYNLDNRQNSYQYIIYDRMSDESDIKEENMPVLSDISEISIDQKYMKLVKKYKNHVNPILTTNAGLNALKVWYLNVIIRKILRSVWLVKNKLISKAKGE